MSALARQACELYARRDALAAELAILDRDLRQLRLQYMTEHKTYGILPANFRREVENTRQDAEA